MIVEQEAGKVEKVFMWVCIAMMIPLFISLSQPVWRGQDMINQMTANCNKVGGIMLKTHGWLSDSYQCSPRLDKGVKE